MPFSISDVGEPRTPIEVGTYAAKVTDAADDDALAETGTKGSTIRYELIGADEEVRQWTQIAWHANVLTRILVAARLIRWVTQRDSGFEQEKLDEFNTGREKPLKMYLVDAETGGLLTDLPSATTLIERTMQVRVADHMNKKTKQLRRDIVDWIMDGQA